MNENQYNNQVEIALQKIEKSLIEDYKDLSKKQNFEMVIIFNPLEKEIKNKIRPFKSLKENLLKDSSFQVIDLYESFDLYFSNSNHKIEDYYWKNDLHNNSKGYLIWAQKVEPKIIKMIKTQNNID
jgi:lysophospholipase L1-like esterase